MSEDIFQGSVLKPTRAGSSNSSETSVPVSGVARDVVPAPATYDLTYPEVVDIGLQRYKSVVLSTEDTLQYMVWAANSSNLTRIEDPSWSITEGYGIISPGSNIVLDSSSPDLHSGVPARQDGSVYLTIRDSQERSISNILTISIRNGDTQGEAILSSGTDFQVIDSESGLVELLNTSTTNSLLRPYTGQPPSMSVLRGDSIVSMEYVVSPQVFWWSRNDPLSTRFDWSDRTQSWSLRKGSSPVEVGVLISGSTSTLDPKPSNLVVGEFLPGSIDGDAWCLIRLGASPDSSSIPLAKNPAGPYDGILIVSDLSSTGEFDFTSFSPPPAAIIGETNGLIQWNPGFVSQYAGRTIWYNYREFQENETDAVAPLLEAKDSKIFVCPVPRIYERPLLRIGSRRYLDTLVCWTESELSLTTVATGQVAVALSTGLLKFNTGDISKSDPDSVDFDSSYLNDLIFYDGVALNLEPQGARPAIKLEDSVGNTEIELDNIYYVPNANSFSGLGLSGIEQILDTTGAMPASGVASIRPGGDDPSYPYTGLIRQIIGFCLPLFFTKKGPITQLKVLEKSTDIPQHRYRMLDDTIYISKENVYDFFAGKYLGSQVDFSAGERQKHEGLELYFQQPYFTPSLYTEKARIASRLYDFFIFEGTEKLYFSIDSISYVWDASTLSGSSPFTAEEVAVSLDSVVTGSGRVYAFSGHVILEAGNLSSGTIEIGVGPSSGLIDLSGCSSLGFVPGWRVEGGNSSTYWLPDSGISLGLSPNLTQDSSVPDFVVTGRIEDEVLQKKISPSEFVFLDPIPLKDIPGYGDNLFFRVQDGDNLVDQFPYEDVLYSFELNRRFSWLSPHTESQEVSRPIGFLYLGQRNIMGEGFLDSIGSSLRVSTFGGPYVEQQINQDFVLDSQTGTATLTSRTGGLELQGYRGSFSSGSDQFEDLDADFSSVSPGYQLKVLTSDATGNYIIETVVSPTRLEVRPAFLVSSSSPVSWEIYKGYPLSVYDPGLIADVVYESFNHLSYETFLIRFLTLLGSVPVSVVDQSLNRLVGEVGRAVDLGRSLSLRVDPQNRQKSWTLGSAVNGLVIPTVGTGSYYYDFELFTLTVGSLSLRPGDASFTKVSSFSVALPSNTVEYIATTGQLKFSSNLLGQVVTYREDTASPTFVGGFDLLLDLLGKEEIGVIQNESLFVPEVGSTRFTNEAFSLQIGEDIFPHGALLEGVVSFTSPFPSNKIEYLLSTGELKFGGGVLSSYALSKVIYVEEFLTPSVMTARFGEIKLNGEINLSEADLISFAGEPIYLVENAVSGPPDTRLNPVDGSFGLLYPVVSGQVVEVQYYQATVSGTLLENSSPIREVLPVYLQGEEASRVSDKIYSFNPDGNTIFEPYQPFVYVGAAQKNRGTDFDFYIDYETSLIHFLASVDSSKTVKITYAIAEALGGEYAYSTSKKPVYRPPFYLVEGQNTFELEQDRTDEMVPGKMLRLGSTAFYVKSSSYDSSTTKTLVELFPTPRQEVGSRSPGRDLISVLSSEPVSVGVTGIPDGNTGFMLALTVPYQSVQKNQRSVTFSGDLTSLVVAGHIFQIGQEPSIITSAELDEKGTYTTITLASPLTREFQYGVDEVRISARPIYPEGAEVLLGPGQLVGEEYEVILFGELKNSVPLPGRTLVPEKEYTVESGSGNLTLLRPLLNGIQPGQRLYMRYLSARVLRPALKEETILYPRFSTSFRYISVPEKTRNKVLLGTYSYYKPDTFFMEAVPLIDYAAEVAQEEAQKAKSQNPGGASLVVSQKGVAGEKGGTDLLSKLRVERDRDRVGRVYLDYYNRIIQFFEQIYEGITGVVIGDRDGKFRFFVGRFRDVPPPGYEDMVTGYLNLKNLWSEVFRSHTVNSGYPLVTTFEDDIVNPSTATLSNSVLRGDFLDLEDLSVLLDEQRLFVRNDLDDYVVSRTGSIRTVFDKGVFPPRRRYKVSGVYKRMAEPQAWSRLYPLRARVFTTTYPGLGADVEPPGVYAYRDTYKNALGETVTASTYNKAIAQLNNPVLGDITNVQKASIGYRLPRAWIWSFSATGYPDIDPSTQGVPCLIASMVPLSEFPVTPEGLPDIQYLISVPPGPPGPSDKYDLSSGNPELCMPPFESISDFDSLSDFYSEGQPQRLALGKPDGTIITLVSTQESFGLLGGRVLSGIFVNEVLQGCLLTLRTPSNPILDANSIGKSTEDPLRADPVSFERGDTIFVVPDEPFEISDEEEANPNNAGVFRIGTDVGLNSETGELIDITPPPLFGSIFTSPVTRLIGTNPPEPLRTIGGSIEFQNTRTEPVIVPALLGENKDDSGDYSVPFLGSDQQEPKILKEIFDRFIELWSESPVPSSIYPEEIYATDGEVLANAFGATPAGVLVSLENFLPGSSLGRADLRPFDFLLMQTDTESGYEGFLSVGDVSYQVGVGSFIEPPRFVTKTLKGDRIRYKFDNCMVHLGPAFLTITEIGGTTVFTIDPAVTISLDDGYNAGNGGLNAIVDNPLLPFPNENRVKIDLFNRFTGVLQESVVITGDPTNMVPTGVVQTSVFPGAFPFVPSAVFQTRIITLPIVGWLNPTLLNVRFHFSISVDTRDVANSYSGTDTYLGSVRGFISDDRLTFNESYDLRNTTPIGTQTIGGLPVQSELSVTTITDWASSTLEINSPAVVNGGSPFNFKDKTGDLGTFALASGSGAGDENGTIKVNSFRGFGNIDLSLSNKIFSGLPSSDYNASGLIFQGAGTADSALDMRLTAVAGVGSIENVQPGDVVVIRENSGRATSKAGTYLVRKAVSEDPGPGYKEIVTASIAGGGGWIEVGFPRVVSFEVSTRELVVSSLLPFPNPSVVTSPTGHGFAASLRVFILTNPSNVISTDVATYNQTCVSATYSAVNGGTNTFTLVAGSYRDAGNNVISVNDFAQAISAGMLVSGMVYFPVSLGGQYDLPEVGFDVTYPYGMVQVDYSTDTSNHIFPFDYFNFGPAPPPPPFDILWVAEKTTVPFNEFVPDPSAAYFSHIPGMVSLEHIQNPTWDGLHNPGVPSSLVSCVLPGDTLELTFHAESGIFLEPTVPRTVFDLAGVDPHVVDSAHSGVLPLTSFGFRGSVEYPSIVEPEPVDFEVRRIRKFHEPLQRISEGFTNLRFLNEVRTGTIDNYTTTSNQYGILTCLAGSNLGGFDDTKVNINPGDVLRLLDVDGSILEEVEIAGILSATELMVNPPGILTNPPSGYNFEIYLQKCPVPYGQSVEQLLEIVTEKTLLRRVANLSTNSGGYVDSTNELKDTEIVTPLSFLSFGIQEGDIVIVDPAGELVSSPVREVGIPPSGDISVSGRPAIFSAGSPSPLDDNRGFYRVTSVGDEELEVTGSSSFAGDSISGDVVFWGGSGRDYVIYPTISDSVLTGGVEGQNDLRLTAYKSGGTFTGDPKSIAPFSYRVIRLRPQLTEEALDLILLERERILSWVELLKERVQEIGGSYYFFQLNAQIYDVLLGTLSNEQLEELGGLIFEAPFANNASCLSILDRRFWIRDFDLDVSIPPGGVDSYTEFRGGLARPVLPDYIDLVLDFRDKVRERRFSWVRFRAHLTEGTLAEIDRLKKRIESNSGILSMYRFLKGDV